MAINRVPFSGLLWGLLAGAAVSCIEAFDPQPKGFQSALVVEGYVTDKAAPHTIRLSRTRPLNDDGTLPETGANVSISSSEGVVWSFAETAPGSYQSQEVAGVADQQYVLDIVTADGEHYQSAPVVLKYTPPIDSIYFEQEQRINTGGETIDGIRILVDAHDPEGRVQYLKYEWVESYEINMPYPAPYDYDPTNPIFPIKSREYHQFCYNTTPGNTILIHSTAGYADARVSHLEVKYVSTEGYRLRSAYSILVRQLALDEQGYTYWRELEKNSENLGTLSDPLPYGVLGNIHNVGDPEEPVLGRFDAAQASEKRLFVYHSQLTGLSYPNLGCSDKLDTVYYEDIPINLAAGKFITVLGPYPEPYVLMSPVECVDCRLYGSIEKPEFWE